jgi:hypothetical protein
MSIAMMMRLEALEKRVAELEQKPGPRQAAAEPAEDAPAPRPPALRARRKKKAAT